MPRRLSSLSPPFRQQRRACRSVTRTQTGPSGSATRRGSRWCPVRPVPSVRSGRRSDGRRSGWLRLARGSRHARGLPTASRGRSVRLDGRAAFRKFLVHELEGADGTRHRWRPGTRRFHSGVSGQGRRPGSAADVVHRVQPAAASHAISGRGTQDHRGDVDPARPAEGRLWRGQGNLNRAGCPAFVQGLAVDRTHDHGGRR